MGFSRDALIGISLLAVALSTGWVDSAFAGEVWLQPDQRISVDLSGKLLTLDGAETELRSFDESVLLVNFWATWCGPCLAEMPSMESLQKQLGGKGLRIVAITDEDPETVKAFLAVHPYSFSVLLDRDGSLTQRLNIWSIPWTLVLDRKRRLVHFEQGARLWDTPNIPTNLKSLLSE